MGRSSQHPILPRDGGRSQLGQRIGQLMLDVVRPVLRWRVLNGNKLVMAFPAHKAADEAAARAFAKERLGSLWRESFTVEGVR